MGLDIAGYKNIKAIQHDNENLDEDYFTFSVNNHFPLRADGLNDELPYSYEEDFHFHAGSYGGYNQWRNELAMLVGWEGAQSAWEADSGPCWELINFSDCEGVIGPITSKKLAEDFAKYQSVADAHHDERFKHLYSQWRKVFEMAADGGCVVFS